MIDRVDVETTISVLKKRFNNLSAEELIKLAYDILEALEKVRDQYAKH